MSYGKGVGRLSPIGDEEMSRVICDIGGRTLLDVACGRGDRLKYIAERFEDMLLSGVELDAENAMEAGNNAPSADIRQASAEELPFCSGAFDIVICECSLSLFDRPDKALCEMYRVLRPNGTLILSDICIKSDRPDVAEATDGKLVRRIFTSAY
ncbi:MAG: class I SAM-dependent methyltransferase, partial [Oscillospiraceae bacterium]|nr:class I SAM-dependent methyltransferase [Oscillospiraceae bacterium]